VIFSDPELGTAGLTETQARAAGYTTATAEYDYRADARAQIAAPGPAEGCCHPMQPAHIRGSGRRAGSGAEHAYRYFYRWMRALGGRLLPQ
jgi:hypothetical protein